MSKLNFQIAVFVLAVALNNVAFTQIQTDASIKILKGKHILLDGKISSGEWDDARRIETSDSVTIYIKHDSRFLYIAVRPEEGVFSVDLYFDRGDKLPLLNFHASAKLGERKGHLGHWPGWTWWNNHGWAANVVQVASFEPLEFLTDKAKEYQIKIKRIGTRRFWLSADVSNGDEVQTIPSKGTMRNDRHWLELSL